MVYKSVFFGYIAAAVAVVAALVLILIMLHQDRQYERRKLLALSGMLVGSLCMNTLYFLSFFDSLTSLSSLYAPVERAADIGCSLVINLCLLVYLYAVAEGPAPGLHGREDGWSEASRQQAQPEAERAGAAAGGMEVSAGRTGQASSPSGPETGSEEERAPRWPIRRFRAMLALLIGVNLFAGIVYVAAVTDEYRASAGHLQLVELAQILLTLVLCLLTVIYTWAAAKSAARRDPVRLIVLTGLVNIVTAVYNGLGSMALFQERFEYVDWSGVQDWNTWLFILSDGLALLIVIFYYNRYNRQAQAVAGRSGNAMPAGETDSPTASQRRPGAAADPAGYRPTDIPIPADLGLTPRETEIARLILRRHTYREIAEALTISEHTVKRHVHNIYEKAGVSRREDLIRKLG